MDQSNMDQSNIDGAAGVLPIVLLYFVPVNPLNMSSKFKVQSSK